MSPYRLLADAVVVLHAAYAGFIVFGLMAILLGIWFRWRWMIGLVAAEAIWGIACPLTGWERRLRAAAGETVHQGSFIGRFAHEVLFVEAPEWALSCSYCLLAAAILATLILAPPRWPWLKV